MVSLWETIKGFALACLCEEQDRNPKGDHGHPSGYNQGLYPCMVLNSLILTATRLIVTLRVLILLFKIFDFNKPYPASILTSQKAHTALPLLYLYVPFGLLKAKILKVEAALAVCAAWLHIDTQSAANPRMLYTNKKSIGNLRNFCKASQG